MVLTKMARASDSGVHVDLTTDAAVSFNRKLKHIENLYKLDFPDAGAVQESPKVTGFSTHVLQVAADTEVNVQVKTQSVILLSLIHI